MGNTRSKKNKKEQPRNHLFESSLTSFTIDEIQAMQIKFNSLAKRSAGPTVDRDTFMKFMKFEDGLLGEQLFTFFDSKNNGVVDFEEFICGLAIFSRGTATQKLEVFFSCYDLNGDGAIHSDELSTMLGHLPTPVLATLRLCKYARTRIPVQEGGLATKESTTTTTNTTAKATTAIESNNSTSTTTTTTTTTPSSSSTASTSISNNSPTPTKHKKSISMSKPLTDTIGVNGQNVEQYIIDIVQDNHIRIIEEMVKVAFENCDLNHDGKLSFAQFAVWVERNSDLMDWMSRTGRPDSDSQNRTPSSSIGNGEQETKETNHTSSSSSSTPIDIQRKGSNKSIDDDRNGDVFGSPNQSQTPNGHHFNEKFDGKVKGEIKFQGHLWKQGKKFKGWKKRHYRIVENFLYFYHKDGDVRPSGAIFLDSIFVEKGSEDTTKDLESQSQGHWPFQIYSSGWVEGIEMTSKTLFAPTKINRDEWMSAIREASHYSEFQDMYDVGRILGRGHFSTVYVAKRRSDAQIFAVKVIDKTSLSEDENELLRSEIAILKLVHHPNIIDTEQIMESKKSLNIVTELVHGGELLQHIAGRKTLSEIEAYTLFRPVISAVEYLHKMGIIHRDIKPENILCEKGFQNIKVADFGLGKLVRPNTVLARKCGTISYVAPEVVSGGGYGKPADMWSVGVVMHLVLRGKLPFQGPNDLEIVDKIQHEMLTLNDKSWRKRSPELIDFVNSLLCKDPSQRPTASIALNHVWMKNIKLEIDGVPTTTENASSNESKTKGSEENGESGEGGDGGTTDGTMIDVGAEGDLESLTIEQLKESLTSTSENNIRLKEELAKGQRLEEKLKKKLQEKLDQDTIGGDLTDR